MFKFRTKITFEGLNLSRTLNQLSQRYTLYGIEKKGKNCQITVESTVCRQVVAYLQEKCYNVTTIQKLGGSFAISFFRKHILVPIFLLLAVALFALSSNFCWKIEISGDYDNAVVLQALEQCNVRVGSNLFRFSADKLENKLATELDAMYAVVNRNGSVLYVNAVKKKHIDEPVNMHQRRDIVATASGRVTYLLCEQGTALVGVGDVVQKGDILIAGVRTFNDGTTENVYALGRAVIQPSVSATAKFTGRATETVETGNVFTCDAVVLFGKTYGKLPPFESFTCESTQTQLFPLNITVQHITYYETQQVTKNVTLEECLEQLKQQAMQLAQQKATFEVQYTLYTVSDAGVTATVFGQIEID